MDHRQDHLRAGQEQSDGARNRINEMGFNQLLGPAYKGRFGRVSANHPQDVLDRQ